MESRIVMTADEVRQALGIGRRQVYDLLNRSDFPSIRLGRKILVPRDAFLRWLDNQAGSEARREA